jgi:CelD/BcsL family acetyltransferase involved in cellulose biosynthesis
MILQLQKVDYPSPAFDALLPDWEALDTQVVPRTPFSSPNWIRLWWQHCRRQGTSSIDELFLHTLRNESGDLIAIAPLMVTRRPAFGPFRLRILQFIGSDPSITEIRGIICKLDHQDVVIRALLEYFTLHHDAFDLFLWRGVRHVGLAPDTIIQLGGFAQDDMLSAYLLELPESWEQLLAGLSSNMRKSIRKSYVFLERDGHKFVFRSQRLPEQLDAALESFFCLHAARSEAQDMKTHLDRLTGHPRHRAIVADFAREMAERGQLHMLQLEIEGAVVATRIAFQLGDDLYLYFSGYDPNWRKYSVMTTLTAETIKWAVKNGMKRVNLSTGTDPGKLRWRPVEIQYHNCICISPTLRGRLASSTHQLTSRIHKAFVRWRRKDE